MTEGTVVAWTPMMGTMRDLILEALHANGGVIHDEKGRVAGRLRELIGAPNEKNSNQRISNVLRQLTTEGTIIRIQKAKRTYDIRLVQPCTEDEATTLSTAQSDNLSILGGTAPLSEIDRLIHDCQRAYEGLQDAADKATRFMDNGVVVIDPIAVLLAAGITTRTRAGAIKYYLRRLGLAYSVADAQESDRRRWWWFVGRAEKQPFRAENLRAMATSNTISYEAQRMAKSGTPWASEVTVRRVEPVTALGDADICDELAAATDDAPQDSTTIEQLEPTMASTFEDDELYKRLVDIAERLECKNERLSAINEELRREAEVQQAAHASEVAALKGEITVLQKRPALDREILDRAHRLIARNDG